jgi:ABC-type ATPase with predicted acetyltransferase domain
MIIQVWLCEDCGQDSRVPTRAQLPACASCGSTRVSVCERQETPAEIRRLVEILEERRGGGKWN